MIEFLRFYNEFGQFNYKTISSLGVEGGKCVSKI